MQVNQISDTFMTTTQISVEDIAAIKEAGIDTIICNRPDGEDAGQPTAAEIHSAAESAGLKFYHVPVSPNAMQPDTMDKFQSAIAPDNGKIIAYCRTGGRCAMLWKMAHQ